MRVKAYLTSLLSVFGALLIATAALAEHIELPTGTDIPLWGTFTVFSAGIQLTVCTADATVDISSQTSTLTGLDFTGGGVCTDIGVPSLPNVLERNGDTITALDLNVTTSIGTCHGDLDGVLTLVNSGNTTRIIYDPAFSTLSGGLFGLGCGIEMHLDF